MNKSLLLFFSLIVLLSSCAPRAVVKPIPANTPPDEIIKMATAGAQDVKGLKASVNVTVQAQGQHPQSLDGVLYIERPDKLRFTGLAFMGVTVFDFVLTEDKFFFYRPSEGWLYTGPKASFRDFLSKSGVQADPEMISRALFIEKKEGELLVEKTEDGYNIYQVKNAQGVLVPVMRAEYDAGLNLHRKVFFDALARPYLYVQLSGKIGGKGYSLPTMLTATDVAQGYSLTVDFEKYLVNPEGLDNDFSIEGGELKGIREVQ